MAFLAVMVVGNHLNYFLRLCLWEKPWEMISRGDLLWEKQQEIFMISHDSVHEKGHGKVEKILLSSDLKFLTILHDFSTVFHVIFLAA